MKDPFKEFGGNKVEKNNTTKDVFSEFGGTSVKKKSRFKASFSRGVVGIQFSTRRFIHFFGYRSTGRSTGIGYFRWPA